MKVVNRTGLVLHADPVPVNEWNRQLRFILKGTFTIVPGQSAIPAAKQRPMSGDKRHMDEIGRSLAWPDDFAPFKPYTDFLVLGTFHQPNAVSQPEGLAACAFGPLHRELRVLGPRKAWRADKTAPWRVEKPEPFTTLPLRWEFSAGGLDDRRNPFGMGQRIERTEDGREVVAMPRIEDPEHPFLTPDDRHRPVNMAPVPSNFALRREKQGTRDRDWAVFRAPLPPRDFDPSFYNCAPPMQMAGNRPVGDECVRLTNLHPVRPVLDFTLPHVRPVLILLSAAVSSPVATQVDMALDTVIVLPDQDELVLLWRGRAAVDAAMPLQASCDLVPLDTAAPDGGLMSSIRLGFRPPVTAGFAKAANQRASEISSMTGEIARLAAHPSVPPDLCAAILAEPDPTKLLAVIETHVDGVLADLATRYPGLLDTGTPSS